MRTFFAVVFLTLACFGAPPRKKATAAATNPFHGDADAASAGKKTYSTSCVGCHGPEGSGVGQYPGLRTTRVKKASDAKLFQIISKGVPDKGMPAFSQLSTDQRWQIVTYLRNLGQ